MAIIGSSAGTALSELGHAPRKDFLRVSCPTRYAVPFATPNTSFTESYRKQTIAEGAKRELETLAGHGFLFPSWIDFDFEADLDAAAEDTAKSRARPPKTCSAAFVFTEPYAEQDFWKDQPCYGCVYVWDLLRDCVLRARASPLNGLRGLSGRRFDADCMHKQISISPLLDRSFQKQYCYPGLGMIRNYEHRVPGR